MPELREQSNGAGFAGFTLGELQLLLLGLWILGEENRVDQGLMREHGSLTARLSIAVQRKTVEARDA
jgi:hypothetical protein